MPRQTRSSAANSPVKQSSSAPTVQTKQTLPITCILPKGVLSIPEARFLTLKHPRDRQPRRYLFCPTTGLYEFTKLNAPTTDPRSILFAPTETSFPSESPADPLGDVNTEISSGYTSNKAEVLVATPVDIIFHVLPLLQASSAKSKSDSGRGLFLPLDDLFDVGSGIIDSHLRHVVGNETYRPSLESRLEAVCDTVDAGDEKMFRLNEDKTLDEVISKAQRLVSHGLPRSLEEKFVTRALETPMLSVKREESNVSIANEVTENGADYAEGSEDLDSQDSSFSSGTPTAVSATSSISSSATLDPITSHEAPPKIRELLRLKTAISYILASYCETELAAAVEAKLATEKSPVDFLPLEEHLKHVASLRTEAMASRSFGDFSRKRSSIEDEDAVEMKAEKKRKLEEEEKRKKANQSRGVRDLKKVNVTGMKKMSDFFLKKATSANAKS